MAKRLNKNLVMVLTVLGMALIAAGSVVLFKLMPEKDPARYVEQAENFAAHGDYEKAAMAYGRAWRAASARDGGADEDYRILAGDMLLKAGDAMRARQFWSQVLLDDPMNEEAQEKSLALRLELAELFGGVNVWSEVEQEATRLLEINPESYVAMHALGRAWVEQGGVNQANVAKGEEMLRKAVEGDTSNPKYARSLANHYVETGLELEAKGKATGSQERINEAQEKFSQAEDVMDTLIAGLSDDLKEQVDAYLYYGQYLLQMKQKYLAELYQRRAKAVSEDQLTPIINIIDDYDRKALNALTEANRRSENLEEPDVEPLIALGEYYRQKRSISTDKDAVIAQMKEDQATAAELYKEAIQKDRHHFTPYLALALLHRTNGEFDEAIQILHERMELGFKRDHYLGWRNRVYMSVVREQAFSYLMEKATALGRLYQTDQQREEEFAKIKVKMEELYNDAVAEAPSGQQDPRVLFMEGRLRLLDQDFGKAIDILEEADKLTPRVDPNIKRSLAYAYLQMQLPDMARTELQELVSANPSDAIAWAMLADIQAKLNQTEAALQSAGIALRLNPNNRQALMAMRTAYLQQKRFAEAEAVTAQLAEASGATDVDKKLQQVVLLRVEAGASDPPDTAKLEQAEKLCEEVLEQDPLNINAIRQYVAMLSNDPSKYDRVREVLNHTMSAAEQAMQQHGESVTTEAGEVINYRRIFDTAERLMVAVDPNVPDEQKIERIVELVKQGKDPFDVALELFSVYRTMPAHAEDAFDQLKRAYELKKDDRRVVDQLFTYALQQQEWKLAEQLIDRAIDLDLDPSGGYFYRGRLYLANEAMPDHAEKAIEQFRIGLKAAPTFQNGHVYLGQALMVVKDYDEAEKAYIQARNMNSNNALAAYRLLQLAAIRKDEAQIARWLEVCERLIPNNELVKELRQNREDREDPRKGIARREELRQANPGDVNNLVALADLYAMTGQNDQADRVYQEALELDPEELRVVTGYARFLASKRNPDHEAAQKLLADFVEKVGPERGTDKAAAQLTLALLLRQRAAMERDSEITQEQVDATFTRAAEFVNTPAVHIDIAHHFAQTRRPARSEEWFRKAVARAEEEDRETIERTARESLIRAMIGQDEPERESEIAREIKAFRSRFPGNPVAILLDAELFILTGQDSKALEQLTRYINSVPEPVQGYFRRGQLYIRSSRWSEAIADFEQLKRLDPTYANYGSRLLLAMAYEESDQVEKAIDELQAVVERAPGYQQAVRSLFALLLSEERYDRAKSLADQREARDPDNPLWHAYLAQIASAQDHADSAVREAETTVDLAMRLPEEEKARVLPGAYDDLIGIYMKFQRYDEIISLIEQRLPDDLKRSAVIMTLASAYAGKGEYERAIETYLKSFEAPYFTPDALAKRLSDDFGSRINAMDLIAAAKRRLEAHPEERQSQLLLAVARHTATKKLTGAEALRKEADQSFQELLASSTMADQAARIEKNFLLKTLAELRMQEKNYDRSRELYEQALTIAPNDVQTLNNLSFVLIDHYNEAEKALPHAEKALSIVPDSAYVMDTVGWCLILMGRYDEGISKVRRSIEGIPQEAEVHYHAAVGFYRRSQMSGNANSRKDLEEAIAECQRAHELLMSKGSDPAGILSEIVKLGEDLGLRLRDQLPDRPAA